MSSTIAITGKGGTGKTTIAALLVRQLIARGRAPVLAVDADPNSCLDTALGVTITGTLGRAREEARDLAAKGLAAGMAKQQLLEMKITESLVEAKDFDLIAMGRPEGPGCYCYANNVLKEVLARTASQYPCVVLDNEAGLENLSRRIVQKVDLLIFAADPSSQGMRTVERLHGLAKEMGVEYRALAVVVNRIPPEAAASSVRVLDGAADIVIGLPEDPELARLGREGGGLWPLAFDNPVMQGLGELLTLAGVCEPTRGSSR